MESKEADNLNRPITRSKTWSIIKFCANKSQDWTASLRILPNIQRSYTDPSQIIPKNWKGGKFIPWSHYYPMPKPDKDITKKKITGPYIWWL